MKIKSNKTFECYETACESWINNGKSITLDGQLLISLDRIKKAIEEMESNLVGLDTWNEEEKREYNAIKKCIEILKRNIGESEGEK